MGKAGPCCDDKDLNTKRNEKAPEIRNVAKQEPHDNELQCVGQHRRKRLGIDEV